MAFRGNVATFAFIVAICFASGMGATVLAQECPLAKSVEITETLILYDAAPEPWWFFPLVLSTVEQIGLVDSGQRVRVCETVHRSTWRQRSLWVRVVDETGGSEEDGDDGDTDHTRAHGWVNAGPVDLNAFLARQGDR